LLASSCPYLTHYYVKTNFTLGFTNLPGLAFSVNDWLLTGLGFEAATRRGCSVCFGNWASGSETEYLQNLN
jgi:hypothetical protein